MEPRWTQGIVIRGQDAVGEYDKVCEGFAATGTGTSEDCVDAGIDVVVCDGIDGTESIQIVLEGDVITMPCDDVEG